VVGIEPVGVVRGLRRQAGPEQFVEFVLVCGVRGGAPRGLCWCKLRGRVLRLKVPEPVLKPPEAHGGPLFRANGNIYCKSKKTQSHSLNKLLYTRFLLVCPPTLLSALQLLQVAFLSKRILSTIYTTHKKKKDDKNILRLERTEKTRGYS